MIFKEIRHNNKSGLIPGQDIAGLIIYPNVPEPRTTHLFFAIFFTPTFLTFTFYFTIFSVGFNHLII